MAPTASGVALLRDTTRFTRQHEDTHAGERLTVEVEHAIARRDHHLAEVIRVCYLHLEDARVVSAGGDIGALCERDSLGEGGFAGRGENRIEIAARAFFERNLIDLAGVGGDESGDLSGLF